jgi:2-hydroxy-3-oxopropionate reductase
MNKTIGFVGLGIMGMPMARNLLKAGLPVVGYDIVHERVDRLIEQGATRGTSLLQVARTANLLITMLPDSPDVENAYLAEDGILAGLRAGSLAIDMSTISPIVAVSVAEAAAKQGVEMLDAPVSGGETGAMSGTLSIMVGGSAEMYQRAEDVFRVLGSATYCGPSGSGQTVKACNQIQVALNLVAMAEALVFGRSAGVDPEIVLKVLSGGYAQSRVMDVRGPKVINGDFTPGFRSRLHFKDLNIVRETALKVGCPLPATSMAFEMFATMQAHGWGDLDHSAVIKVVELLSDRQISRKSPS